MFVCTKDENKQKEAEMVHFNKITYSFQVKY